MHIHGFNHVLACEDLMMCLRACVRAHAVSHGEGRWRWRRERTRVMMKMDGVSQKVDGSGGGGGRVS